MKQIFECYYHGFSGLLTKTGGFYIWYIYDRYKFSVACQTDLKALILKRPRTHLTSAIWDTYYTWEHQYRIL